eukprot:3538070-Pleurochrysis_carterae.AAC.1
MEIGGIRDPTSSEGEEEGQVAEQRRERRKTREVTMEVRRAQRDQLLKEHREVSRNITLEEQEVRELRKQLEERWHQKQQ